MKTQLVVADLGAAEQLTFPIVLLYLVLYIVLVCPQIKAGSNKFLKK